MRSMPTGTIENVLGAVATMGASLVITGWTVGQAYAALPSVYPANGTFLQSVVAPYALFRTQ
jgi:hypothetical protein